MKKTRTDSSISTSARESLIVPSRNRSNMRLPQCCVRQSFYFLLSRTVGLSRLTLTARPARIDVNRAGRWPCGLNDDTEGPTAKSPRRVTAYELASRMSSFLWCSIPDAELLALARNGKRACTHLRHRRFVGGKGERLEGSGHGLRLAGRGWLRG